MKILKFEKTLLLCLFLSAFSCSAQKQINQDSPKGYSEIIANSDIESQLTTEQGKTRITGRVSLNFKASEEDLKAGIIRVRALNLSFFQVNQRQIAKDIKLNDELGFLGVAIDNSNLQILKLSSDKNKIEGELKIFIDASFLNSITMEKGNENSNNDEFLTPIIPAVCRVIIDLEKPINDNYDIIQSVEGKLTLRIESREQFFNDERVAGLAIETIVPKLKFDFADIFYFEAVQSLCIQPVFINNITVGKTSFWGLPFIRIETTGEGLNFGKPELEKQWRKADVVFNIREPKYLFVPDYFVFSESENVGLRNLVDDDDCIEVFFVHEFSPNDLWGGGAAYGSGTGSAKVISTDENARSGVDFTHLAHEIGHVLGLLHPGGDSTASAVAGSTGTLMCPSGFENDNPQINSEENRQLISNPLLRFSFQRRKSLSPDCNDSTDCGACPGAN